MEIRKLEPEEHGNTRHLYEEVFREDGRAFVDYYYTEKTKDNQIYAVEEDGEIQAMLHLNPYTLLLNGSERSAHYIVAVATRREYRKRGYMAALLRRALEDMYQAGEAFTYLMPAAESIYLPHGFRTVYEQEKWETAQGVHIFPECRKALEDSEKAVPRKCTVCRAEEADCRETAAAAEEYLSGNYDIYAKRDETYYRRFLKECESEGGKLMLCRENGKIMDAYVYYEKEDAQTGERTEEAAEEKPKIMARIVDVRKMLLCMRLRSLAAACFTVADPLIAGNNRCIAVTGTEFSGVMLMDGLEENSEGVVTVEALGSLLFGVKDVEEVCREEGVEMTERLKGELGKIIPFRRIYLNEDV